MKKFISEFMEFAIRGNVMNLAVGVIIGAAFQNIVKSLTDNILSPILGLFTGANFDQVHLKIFGVELMYGAFITSVINFIILAFVVFLLVKFMTKLMSIGKRPHDEPAPSVRPCPFCLTEINDKATRCPACTSVITE